MFQVAMATGQVLFHRFFYSKSFVKHSFEVREYKAVFTSNADGSHVVWVTVNDIQSDGNQNYRSVVYKDCFLNVGVIID